MKKQYLVFIFLFIVLVSVLYYITLPSTAKFKVLFNVVFPFPLGYIVYLKLNVSEPGNLLAFSTCNKCVFNLNIYLHKGINTLYLVINTYTPYLYLFTGLNETKIKLNYFIPKSGFIENGKIYYILNQSTISTVRIPSEVIVFRPNDTFKLNLPNVYYVTNGTNFYNLLNSSIFEYYIIFVNTYVSQSVITELEKIFKNATFIEYGLPHYILNTNISNSTFLAYQYCPSCTLLEVYYFGKPVMVSVTGKLTFYGYVEMLKSLLPSSLTAYGICCNLIHNQEQESKLMIGNYNLITLYNGIYFITYCSTQLLDYLIFYNLLLVNKLYNAQYPNTFLNINSSSIITYYNGKISSENISNYSVFLTSHELSIVSERKQAYIQLYLLTDNGFENITGLFTLPTIFSTNNTIIYALLTINGQNIGVFFNCYNISYSSFIQSVNTKELTLSFIKGQNVLSFKPTTYQIAQNKLICLVLMNPSGTEITIIKCNAFPILELILIIGIIIVVIGIVYYFLIRSAENRKLIKFLIDFSVLEKVNQNETINDTFNSVIEGFRNDPLLHNISFFNNLLIDMEFSDYKMIFETHNIRVYFDTYNNTLFPIITNGSYTTYIRSVLENYGIYASFTKYYYDINRPFITLPNTENLIGLVEYYTDETTSKYLIIGTLNFFELDKKLRGIIRNFSKLSEKTKIDDLLKTITERVIKEPEFLTELRKLFDNEIKVYVESKLLKSMRNSTIKETSIDTIFLVVPKIYIPIFITLVQNQLLRSLISYTNLDKFLNYIYVIAEEDLPLVRHYDSDFDYITIPLYKEYKRYFKEVLRNGSI